MSDGNDSTVSPAGIFDIILTCFALFMFVLDIILDIVLLFNYHASGDSRWFAFTLTVLLLSSLIVNAISVWMGTFNYSNRIVVICFILQVVPVLRYVAFSVVLTLKYL